MDTYVLLGFLAGAVFLKSCYTVYTEQIKRGILFLKKCRSARVSNTHLAAKLNYNPFEIVLEVSRRAGISPPEVLIVPKLTGNAAIMSVCGKNVLVCKLSLLRRCSPEEFEGVVAHEIGHLFLGKIRRFLMYGIPVVFSQIVWCTIISGVTMMLHPTSEIFRATTPIFFALLVAFVVGRGCLRFFERREEFAADKIALSLTRYPSAFVCFLSRIKRKETAYEYPAIQSVVYGMFFRTRNHLTAFLYDIHPPGWKRAAAAQKILKKQSAKK